MATPRKPFGNRTSAEGIAANKKAAPPPAPKKEEKKPVVPPKAAPPKVDPRRPKDTLYSKTSVERAIKEDSALQGEANAKTFMQIINGMPPETKNRYLSSFTDFLALDPTKQAAYLSGLEEQAKDIVKPKIDRDRKRLGEDFEYEKEKRESEKRALQSTFDKIKKDMDFNKNRDIAKENETAAKVMQNVGNVAFVTGVAGSGIFSRRTSYVRENLQNNVDDVNVDYNQKLGSLSLKKGISDNEIDTEIDRLYQLNERDITDLDQDQKEDELSMFFELAGNKFGQKGEQNAALLEAGTGSALEDFVKGGTDAERKDKYAKEVAAKEKARVDAIAAAVGAKKRSEGDEYRNLFELTRALGALGRQDQVAPLQERMNQIRGSAEGLVGEGKWQSAYGYGNISDVENAWSRQFAEKNNLLYRGMNEEARKRLTKLIDENRDTITKYQS